MKSESTVKQPTPELNRTLSLPQLAFYGTGTILGAGIYALIGKVVGTAGYLSVLAFIASAILASLTAYSYSRLVSRYPRSGGEAEFVYHGFRSQTFSNLVGWLVVFTGTVSGATLVAGFTGYFRVFFAIPDAAVAVGLICAVTTVAIVGIRESAWVIVTITVIEIAGLLLVCATGFGPLVEKEFLLPEIAGALEPAGVIPVLGGAFLAFYAYIGFEDIVNLAEETREPEKNTPRAIFIALSIATVLYLLVALVALASMSIDALGASEAPLADMYATHGGDRRLLSAIGLVAIVNGVLAQLIMASRILYGMRHKVAVFRIFSRVHAATRTPVIATLFVTALILLLTLAFPISTLASATSFIILIVFSLINVALILTELRQETYKIANFVIPAIATLLNTAFLIFKISQGFSAGV